MSIVNVSASCSDQLRDAYTSSVVPMDVHGCAPSFNADLRCWSMGESVSVVHLRTAPVTLERGATQIAKCTSDSLILGLNIAGKMYGSVNQSLCGLAGISASLLPMDIPWSVVVQTDVDHLTVRMSRSALPIPDSVVERGVMRAIPESNPYLRVLAGYLQSVEESAALLDNAAAEAMGSVALELVANMLSGLVGELRDETSVEVLLPLMVQFIRENFANPDLCVGMISAKFHVSERYVQRVFAAMDATPREMIRRLRINRARELLADPTRTVAGIAGAVGFMDLSTFHRAFKRETGMTSREWRECSQSATAPVANRQIGERPAA